jgi:hypothetical protein
MEKSDTKIKTQNKYNTLISLAAAGMSAIYQNNFLQKSSPKASNQKRILFCASSAMICFIMTRAMLSQVDFITA